MENNYRNNRKSRRVVKKKPWWPIAVMDILITGVCLVVFAYFHHVRPSQPAGPIVVVTRPTAASAVPTSALTPAPSGFSTAVGTGAPTEGPTATPTADLGDFGAAYADKFSDTVISTDTVYKSNDISIEVITGRKYDSDYRVLDIYVRNIDNLKVGLAQDAFQYGVERESMQELAGRKNALAALSGQMYSLRREGICIANGAVYRDKAFNDVCVLYYDGTVETFAKDDFNMQTAIDKGAYQAWGFGPMLLNNGQVMESFTGGLNPKNPRSVFGYFAPGHYCFITISGIRGTAPTGSKGMTTKEASQLVYDLGCKAAYNLDGGDSAMQYFNKTDFYAVSTRPARVQSDIIYIAENDN